MIRNAADLLQKLLAEEKSKLAQWKIPHNPTIGDMFEGLSREALNKALPFDGLQVLTGFIKDRTGAWSRQLDCMVVVGEGTSIPYTDARVFSLDEVIAVVEVKKNLYSEGLDEGFTNLKSVLRLDHEQPPAVGEIVQQCFHKLTKKPLPADKSQLSLLDQGIYWSLVTEAAWPVRIILGYYGYKSYKTFRKGIIDHLASLDKIPGWNSASIPSCIIGPGYSAVKNTAMPWGHPTSDGWWNLLMTNDILSPAYVLLEMIWTRLNLLGLIPSSWFGEDLTNDAWDKFIDAKPESKQSWSFRPFIDLPPATTPNQCDWMPAFVGLPAFTLVGLLCECQPEPLDLSMIEDDEVQAAVAELELHGIAGRDVTDQNKLHFLTEGCSGVILPDGRFAVGENNSGRLTRWVMKFNTKAVVDCVDS